MFYHHHKDHTNHIQKISDSDMNVTSNQQSETVILETTVLYKIL